MRRVSIRELQQQIRRVLEGVERGEIVEVTRRRRAIARLSPMSSPHKPSPWPDLEARARVVLGTRKMSPSPSVQLLRDRGDW